MRLGTLGIHYYYYYYTVVEKSGMVIIGVPWFLFCRKSPNTRRRKRKRRKRNPSVPTATDTEIIIPAVARQTRRQTVTVDGVCVWQYACFAARCVWVDGLCANCVGQCSALWTFFSFFRHNLPVFENIVQVSTNTVLWLSFVKWIEIVQYAFQ